jgi:TetR/AcrR family transcriptional repressor of nem operon
MAGRHAGTPSRILDIAERLVQTRGFNAFSYADIAKILGVQKASLHHHFATKADLGLALIGRYRTAFLAALAAIENDHRQAAARLRAYVALYGTVLRRRRMCLCGMLAADVSTLPKPLRESLAGFFVENEGWLERVLEEGRRRGEINFDGGVASLASFVVSSLEGAMLVARGSGDLDEFERVAERLLRLVGSDGGAARARRRSSR